MVIHTAGPRSLALFFEQDELSEDEACPGQDKIKCVVEIARATFCRQGIQAKYFEIEEYEGEAGTVIFVLAGENVGRLLFSFSSVAKAASAVRALREDRSHFPPQLLPHFRHRRTGDYRRLLQSRHHRAQACRSRTAPEPRVARGHPGQHRRRRDDLRSIWRSASARILARLISIRDRTVAVASMAIPRGPR